MCWKLVTAVENNRKKEHRPAPRNLLHAQGLRVCCSEKVTFELSFWRLGVNQVLWEEGPCPGRGSEQGKPGRGHKRRTG